MNVSDSILTAVEILIKHCISSAPFDKTVRGRIISAAANNKYIVELYGNQYEIPAYSSSVYNPNEIVWVVIPQGNFNEKFLLPK